MLTATSSMTFHSKITLGERNLTQMQSATKVFTLPTFARQLSLTFLTGGHLPPMAMLSCIWPLQKSIPSSHHAVEVTECLQVPWVCLPFKWAVMFTRVRTIPAQSNGSVTKIETFQYEYLICASPPARIRLPTLRCQHLSPTVPFQRHFRNAT